MKSTSTLPALALVLLLAAEAFSAHADDGHDHGEAPATAAGPALPRFAATSETFELVGVLHGERLRLYLDHAGDNSPVKDARLELELAGAKLKVEPHGEGEFEAVLAGPLQAGVIAVTATVLAGPETGLLAGELDIHPPEHADEAAPGFVGKKAAGWAAAAALALGALAFAARRIRTARVGGVA